MIKNKRILLLLLEDYIKNNFKKKLIISLGEGEFMSFLKENICYTNIKIKKINLISKKKIKNNKKTEYLKFKKKLYSDLYIGDANFFGSYFFYKGNNGVITKEKIIYLNSKNRIIIVNGFTNKKFCYLPIEVLPKLINFVVRKLIKLNIDFKIKKKRGNIFFNDNKLNIINIKCFYNKNPYVYEKKILSIKGVVETGMFLIFKNTTFILSGKKKFMVFEK
ncbi:ribose-5-phosphate isomerase A [Candidatus Vidania fulgoroideorum]